MSPRLVVWIARFMIIPFIAIPLLLTYFKPPPALAVLMAASAVAQAGIFFFTVTISMYRNRATKWGVLATMIYGLIVMLLHPKYGFGPIIGLVHWGIWAMMLILGCGLVYFIVSLLTSKKK